MWDLIVSVPDHYLSFYFTWTDNASKTGFPSFNTNKKLFFFFFLLKKSTKFT